MGAARDCEMHTTTANGEPGVVFTSVGAEFPLADALLAYRHKPARGKVVLRVGDAG